MFAVNWNIAIPAMGYDESKVVLLGFVQGYIYKPEEKTTYAIVLVDKVYNALVDYEQSKHPSRYFTNSDFVEIPLHLIRHNRSYSK